jgi:hypothetical protein
VVGALLRVPIGHGWHGYALTLPDAEFAFFDARMRDAHPIDEAGSVVGRAVLFRLFVFNKAVTSGRWMRVGKVDALPDELARPVPRFMQDALCPDRYSIYVSGESRPATLAECEGLEKAAVWEAEHVEDRLRDHYAGVPNKWVESLRPYDSIEKVRAVLLRERNPQCVDGEADPGFYDGCIMGICVKLRGKIGVEKLADHLSALERVSMRVATDRERCVRAAKSLVKIKL